MSFIELLALLLVPPETGVVFCDLGCRPGLGGLPRCAKSRFLLGRLMGVVGGPDKGFELRSLLTAASVCQYMT